jgi:hypothetical protein
MKDSKMILKTVKTAVETGIEGVEFVTVDKQIIEVVIGKLRVRKSDSYTKALEVVIEAPHELVERFRLTATIKGFPDAISYHESKYDAESAGANLEDVGAKIEIERVDVLVADGGMVIGEASGKVAPAAAGDEMPF